MQYLGVEKTEIEQTLKEAEIFLRNLNLGPETVKALNKRIYDQAAYKNLTHATDEKTIASAIASGGLTEQYRRSADLFRYHIAEEKDGRIQDLFNRLSAFATFNGMTTHEYRPTDAEEQQYLLKRYIAHYAELADEKAFQDVIDGFIERNPKRNYSDIETILSKLTTALSDDEKFAEIFEQTDLHKLYVITDALKAATGLGDKMNAVSAASPHDVYGIALDNMPRDYEESSKLIEPLLEKIQPIIKKYRQTGDIEMGVMVGMIRQKAPLDDLSGLSFFVTKRVAQEIANVLPDQKLINFEGQRVMPQPKTVAPNLHP